ncbi:MAG: hypothetical protein AAFS07_00335 [Pseudomonadota bacterium]
MADDDLKLSSFDYTRVGFGLSIGLALGLAVGYPMGNFFAHPSSSEVVEREREVEEARLLIDDLYDLLDDEALEGTLSETTRSAIAESKAALDEGDRLSAITALPDALGVLDEAECKRSGVRFKVGDGDLVRNCETGMDVVIGSVNTNSMLTAVIGGRRVAERAGGVLSDGSGRYPNCFFRYHTPVEGEEPPKAYVSFDCAP